MTRTDSRSCLLFFVKAPEPGKVKTRLIPCLGAEGAAEAYRAFGRDMRRSFSGLGVEVIVCFAPQGGEAAVREWLGEGPQYIPQAGADLGARMKNAFAYAFAHGFERAALIGSDLPDLPSAHAAQAFAALEEHGAALAPARDGGYYCIAFRRAAFQPEAFEGIAWSTPEVFARTLAVLDTNAAGCAVLPEWFDVDDCGELKELHARLEKNRGAAPETCALLRGVFRAAPPGRE